MQVPLYCGDSALVSTVRLIAQQWHQANYVILFFETVICQTAVQLAQRIHVMALNVAY